MTDCVNGVVGRVSLAGSEVTSWFDYGSLHSGANAVFLTPMTFNQSGVLFAFIVHCRNLSPVRLQVWRPELADQTQFRLVCQRRIVPNVDQIRQRAVVSCYLPFRVTYHKSSSSSSSSSPSSSAFVVRLLHAEHRRIPRVTVYVNQNVSVR